MSDSENNISLAVLLTCHNRKKNTIECLESLKKQTLPNTSITIFLVDDGSTDGTSAAVKTRFSDVVLIAGDGSLYWCGGMRLAFSKAMEENYDFYLWLNDDTNLNNDALLSLFQTHEEVKLQLKQPAITIGSTYDKKLQTMSYGGWRKLPGKRLSHSWGKVFPDPDHWITCDTMNGNFVLIPRAVVKKVNNLDSHFTHGMGDLDYGLRAQKKGCYVVIAKGYYGYCFLNNETKMWLNEKLPIWRRWKSLLGPKGLPIKEWMVFSRRHKGKFWILAWLNPYVMFWVRVLTNLFKFKS